MTFKPEKLRTIPIFLEQALDYLAVKGLETEGIFRLSTRKQDIEDLQHAIESQYGTLFFFKFLFSFSQRNSIILKNLFKLISVSTQFTQ